MCKEYKFNNKDRIEKQKKINIHNLKIKSLINVLSLKMGVPNTMTLSSMEPYIIADPQNRPYGMNKQTAAKICALPKYLINKPKTQFIKGKDIAIFSFPVVSFAPVVNNSKSFIITNGNNFEVPSVQNNKAILSLYELNVVFKLKTGDYAIHLHQNCFEKNIRQPFYIGRCELGGTHNTKHELVQRTFHIHTPTDETIDTKFQNTLLAGIYHCNPEIYSNNDFLPLDLAIHIACKKYNIRNDLDEAVDIRDVKTVKFLDSDIGKDWLQLLAGEKHETLNFNQTSSIISTYSTIDPPKRDVTSYIKFQI